MGFFGGGVSIGSIVGSGVDYNVLSVDGSGNLSQIGPTSSGYVLTSNGTGAASTGAGATYAENTTSGYGAIIGLGFNGTNLAVNTPGTTPPYPGAILGGNTALSGSTNNAFPGSGSGTDLAVYLGVNQAGL